MSGQRQRDAHSVRRREVQRQDRVRGESGEQGPRLNRPEAAGKALCRGQRSEAEAGHRQGLLRPSHKGPERSSEHVVHLGRQRTDPPAIGSRILAEPGGGCGDVALEEYGGAIVERVGDRHRRRDPLHAELGEGKSGEERRCRSEGVGGGADVVPEAGEGQLGGASAAADLLVALHDEDGQVVPGELDGRGQSVRPGSNDDGVIPLDHAARLDLELTVAGHTGVVVDGGELVVLLLVAGQRVR